jgi:hypothetical protein
MEWFVISTGCIPNSCPQGKECIEIRSSYAVSSLPKGTEVFICAMMQFNHRDLPEAMVGGGCSRHESCS